MFDSMFAGADESALVAVIEQAARAEDRASSRRYAAIAELVGRTVVDDDERSRHAFDPWSNTAAQIGAVLTSGQRRASGQMRIAMALRDRLPKVAALFCQGRISARLISELTWRTQLVDDGRLMGLIDDALARRATAWGPLSEVRLERAIDAVIERYDPDAVRLAKDLLKDRDIRVGAREDGATTATLWGRLTAADAVAAQRRLAATIAGVCPHDPRSIGQRRSDAMGALMHGNQHLACRCGLADCTATTAAPASNIVIRVIADRAAIVAAQDHITATDQEAAAARAEAAEAAGNTSASEETGATDAAPPPLTNTGLALLPGCAIMPTALLAEAIRNGARIKPMPEPAVDAEPGYRPSAALAEFVRMRDLFCRFPGCDVPADRCDIDHCVPWPHGPTHPSNLNCACRTHHLMKTFWDGPNGWHATQHPDATLSWTAPTGHTYITTPGSQLLYPNWTITTADLPPPPPLPPPDPARCTKMPTRRRLRSAESTAWQCQLDLAGTVELTVFPALTR